MKVLIIFGTRPEAIKLAPLILELGKTDSFQVHVCTSGQHKELLDQVLDFFSITPDYKLDLMIENQTLAGLTSKLTDHLDKIILANNPDLIVVQGDTATAYVGALIGYYHKINVAHIEAGLRSGNKYEPFPEELNRKMISQIAKFHFAPTKRNVLALKAEGIVDHVYEVGNTVIDALIRAEGIISKKKFQPKFANNLDPEKKWILITGHRRENFGDPIREVFEAIGQIVADFQETEIVFPVHFNPNVRSAIENLKNKERVHLMDPVSYQEIVWLIQNCYLIITDSGGIQEEAPYFGKPVLVTRNVTERQEGIEVGTSILVGTDKQKIVNYTKKLLEDEQYYLQFSKIHNPYGDGHTSKRIMHILNYG